MPGRAATVAAGAHVGIGYRMTSSGAEQMHRAGHVRYNLPKSPPHDAAPAPMNNPTGTRCRRHVIFNLAGTIVRPG